MAKRGGSENKKKRGVAPRPLKFHPYWGGERKKLYFCIFVFFYHFSTDCLNAVSILLSVQYYQSIKYNVRGENSLFSRYSFFFFCFFFFVLLFLFLVLLFLFFVLRSSFFTALPVTLLNSAPNSVKFDHNMEANNRTLKIEVV